ncbi:hypothetical protein J415_18355 [Klebsiella michiganensis HKOPL1]|uniref:Uncharacterized protein n=1 Tax=Klebsiella michiganensis (strain ATCC 8724 / DSM 4798 / JCM 20051 / NBRC 3318 / NRRL B-199 / KCTC 1686 / BUCSAV 143 / CCM 1901) TaxID=1006551 RepID=A0A0H3H8E4_KLEM8|nr:hypothetical protein KOX_19270 [Klebsiella michiganensis KCTC 1686]AHW89113.1 hypothetical protein J415_18355 [Klebsiella michiganensis HKOPL1]AIE70207.1 hypothetical protein HR38_17610 [Klebsiella michiganensis]APM34699.1 hypothetical protein AGH21_30715 [Klebsiella oxytoca]
MRADCIVISNNSTGFPALYFPQCEAVVSARKLAMLRPIYLWSAGVFLAMNIDLPVAHRATIVGSFTMPNKSIWIIYMTEKMSA